MIYGQDVMAIARSSFLSILIIVALTGVLSACGRIQADAGLDRITENPAPLVRPVRISRWQFPIDASL